MKEAAAPSASYQLFMLVLCVYALATLAVQTAARLDPAILQVLEYADFGVCAIFFADFLFSLWRALKLPDFGFLATFMDKFMDGTT